MTFGIIGFGRFGKLWARCLAPYGRVLVYDKNVIKGKGNYGDLRFVNLTEAVRCDMLFLLVPISEMKSCCRQIMPLLEKNTLVVDACSVKVYPAKIMRQELPANQPVIATHPLFGPDSSSHHGLAGHKIVVCPIRATNRHKNIFLTLLKGLGLKVIISTPQEHDHQLARSQALVHFIGRGLIKLDLREQLISTPDYHSLLKMNTMVQNDTWQLFFDMQKYNPHSVRIRKIFLKELQKLENKIEVYGQC